MNNSSTSVATHYLLVHLHRCRGTRVRVGQLFRGMRVRPPEKKHLGAKPILGVLGKVLFCSV